MKTVKMMPVAALAGLVSILMLLSRARVQMAVPRGGAGRAYADSPGCGDAPGWAGADSPERGDVPGWVMITLMSAVLVAGLLAIAGPALEGLFRAALDQVNPGK
jgi:hypothetical protein